MNVITALLGVALLLVIVLLGAGPANAGFLFGVIVPYAAVVVFIAGFIYKVVSWARAPVPFRIPTTCGQQKTLPFFKASNLESPSNTLGVVGRMALEVLFFRSLFRNTEAEVVKGMNLVDQKLAEALEYFYNGKYNEVVELANDVLSIDPSNALAYKRIGSAYFAIGQKEKAIENWQKSLRLNPKDLTLKTFINKAKEQMKSSSRKELQYLEELENREGDKFFE